MIEFEMVQLGSVSRDGRIHQAAGCIERQFRKRVVSPRLQRMNKDMYHGSWKVGSVLMRNRIFGMLLAFGLLAFASGAFAQQNSQTRQNSQMSQDSQTQQDSEMPQDSQMQQGSSRTETGDSGDAGSAALYNKPASGLDQTNEDMSDDDTQDTDDSGDSQPSDAAASPSMSAEQIISILKQEPGAMSSIKEQVAQETGSDPTSFTDASLYQRIRQSSSVRALATKELSTRGYSVDQTQTVRSGRSERRGGKTSRPANAASQPYKSPDDPQVQRKINPYSNLPSLSDIYTQFPLAQPKLRRFGSDAFLIGSGNANALPLDLPAGPEYVVGPGDTLTLNMWGTRSVRLSRTIDRQGQVELPEAGAILISGMTIAQAQVAIEKLLNTQFHNEHVEISLGRVRSVRVYVVGDVQRPGAYDVSSLSTPLNALYEAGGPTSRGSLRVLRQYRGMKLVKEVDLYDFLLHGMRSEDEKLLPGDTILVPPAGPQVAVEGMVRRPAIYELNGEAGLDQVLDIAGGVLVSASMKEVKVQRIEAHESRSMFNLQLPDSPAELQSKLAAFKVKDGDKVLISQILPYNSEAVYVQGHVFRPGKFPYREGMTIADLLHSYQDVLPEPSEHGELVRLQPPDMRPATISFNLRDVLVGNETIPLRPFDVIRVYGRYEMDSPTVSIQGEVLRPGSYPMSQGMTVAGLVRLAGGFRRSAFREEADLASYTVQGSQKVVTDHASIAIQKALDGDKNADASLKPGDVVSIRRLAGWQDIGASISISGEIAHPGSYGIKEGERLSSVLRRAGGFTINAYPYAARLERVRVRELGEQARLQMIQRIQETPLQVKQGAMSTTTVTAMQDTLQAQRDEILRTLRNRPASGRLVIRISSDIAEWENTSADIQLRAGDTLIIPKRPDFVSISGQVYNPVAISYSPNKKLGWYLKSAGGATQAANRRGIYVLRADGTVVPQPRGWFTSGLTGLRMRPGDTIFVPEKIVGGSMIWQNILGTAQIMTATAIPLAAIGVL
jgi:protein involved in polysaccharide export with SLBB domain